MNFYELELYYIAYLYEIEYSLCVNLLMNVTSRFIAVSFTSS